jgi:uncharacterized protein (DUF2141 family)
VCNWQPDASGEMVQNMSGRSHIAGILAGLAIVWMATLPVHAADLSVTVQGVSSDVGELLLGVYSDAAGFQRAIDSSATKSALLPQAWRIVGASLRAKAGSQSITFIDLPPGRYAVIAFHDENDNGLLDANSFGVPTEGYCFSNDAMGFLGAPSFDAAAVTLGEGDKKISMTLVYPRSHSLQDQAELRGFLGK